MLYILAESPTNDDKESNANVYSILITETP